MPLELAIADVNPPMPMSTMPIGAIGRIDEGSAGFRNGNLVYKSDIDTIANLSVGNITWTREPGDSFPTYRVQVYPTGTRLTLVVK